jgi:hypothetical protein
MKFKTWFSSFVLTSSLLPLSALAANTIHCENTGGPLVSVDIAYGTQGFTSITSSSSQNSTLAVTEAVQSLKYLSSFGDGVPFTNEKGHPMGTPSGVDNMLITTATMAYSFNWNRIYSGSTLSILQSNNPAVMKSVDSNSGFTCWNGRDENVDAINAILKAAPRARF